MLALHFNLHQLMINNSSILQIRIMFLQMTYLSHILLSLQVNHLYKKICIIIYIMYKKLYTKFNSFIGSFYYNGIDSQNTVQLYCNIPQLMINRSSILFSQYAYGCCMSFLSSTTSLFVLARTITICRSCSPRFLQRWYVQKSTPFCVSKCFLPPTCCKGYHFPSNGPWLLLDNTLAFKNFT